MKIIEIKRTVSDMNYNNTSATATLADGEDPISAAIELDAKIKEMMAGIADKTLAVEGFRREKKEAVNILQAALDHAQKQDIPF
jgi:multidrug efflux pump subunit AcrB